MKARKQLKSSGLRDTARAPRAGKNRHGWSKEGLEKYRKTVSMLAAAKERDFGSVKELIGMGADIEGDIEDEVGTTILMDAAYKGDLDAVNAYIEMGADVNAQDYSGFTVLNYAIGGDHLDVVKALIANGADINEIRRNYNETLASFSMNPSKELEAYIAAQLTRDQEEGIAEQSKMLLRM